MGHSAQALSLNGAVIHHHVKEEPSQGEEVALLAVN